MVLHRPFEPASLKGEVKKKHNPTRRIFSCFAAHLFEQDLKAWQKACVSVGLGTLTKVVGKPDPRYNELIIHDLWRSAMSGADEIGVREKVAMKISGRKTCDVFDPYRICRRCGRT